MLSVRKFYVRRFYEIYLLKEDFDSITVLIEAYLNELDVLLTQPHGLSC